jgi:hypothetical protein
MLLNFACLITHCSCILLNGLYLLLYADLWAIYKQWNVPIKFKLKPINKSNNMLQFLFPGGI